MQEKEANIILDKFIEAEMKKCYMGSGDDLAHALELREYINKQRGFWLHSIMFFIEVGKVQAKKEMMLHWKKVK